ncbi:hypothetical protein A6395_06115 [Exiguobacterium sp. SH31]|uniref:AbrB/MazE/SpoVT family DNA-binding domain-containing protein n=1 Tax=unclassified Exiguobacterium TaxID=2644629 RepID=UPI0008C7BF87|nr:MULTISPECIES: hypothetical protein [unclassified Exiguobacterium]OGX79584.1 hypothetical protein A6395_06115 [Exiguobacterium sp. SH31]TCI71034.1 hypothetical protein EVJ22_06975 [Exiguobacterium sp. SH0S7]
MSRRHTKERSEVVVRRVGGSKGVTLPKAMSTDIGDKYYIQQHHDGTIILTPFEKPRILKNVFADIDEDTYADMNEVILGEVGQEAE